MKEGERDPNKTTPKQTNKQKMKGFELQFRYLKNRKEKGSVNGNFGIQSTDINGKHS